MTSVGKTENRSHLKIIAGGGGAATKSSSSAIREALSLSSVDKPSILIIPTPKRTTEAFEATVPATQRFFESLGLKASLLHGFNEEIDFNIANYLIGLSDVIYTTGGDTLYMMDQLRRHNLTKAIADRALSGDLVLSGISAGAILPMTWGHSDSFSYRQDTADNWQYTRVDALGLVPVAITPHFNSVNPRLGARSEQFATMLQNEGGYAAAFGIDNLAAVKIVEGNLTQFQSDPAHYVHIAQREEDGSIKFQPMSKHDIIKLSDLK